ncbi:PREDICTED: HAUS augmin-like complex subunit 2 [Poecilia mexicana]|uniref:HAUS augmin-like complex, subunit 2 n=1 Tax=Poecilia mexicana TaxID=48701 RepID=A0A3B3WW85_9TELE|nr:PREDICTED: HAUS augmin-like complex subunit 2 [Poecilia mexicana]XP_014824128.1 PREDICTED: HAUS augmin-like complex subunit 2 [Poecilia mexicana]
MHQWDLSPFSVTPAACLLSRCVSVGAASQDEIDSAFSEPSPVFSARLREAEELIRKQKRLDEVQLQLELLKVDEQSADVAHGFHLSQKNEKLQLLGNHLLGVLREHKVLRQRLMQPLARTNLPVLAHLHASVVDSIRLMMDFIECLEEKLRSTHNRTTSTDSLTLLDNSLALLLTMASESEMLFQRIQQWRSISCRRPEASEAQTGSELSAP